MKNMKNRKTLTAIILLLIFLVTTACQKQSTDNLGQSAGKASAGTGTGGHIQKQLVSNLAVNADVIAPSNVRTLNTLWATPLKYDTQKVQALESQLIANSKITNQFNNGKVKLLQTADGKQFSLEGNLLRFQTGKFQYINQVFRYLPSDPAYTADKFHKNKDLSFMPYQQAVNQVKKTLTSLGISVYDQVETYALDYQTMQAQEKILKEKGDLTSPKDGSIKLKAHWNVKDDGYFMIIRNGFDGIPVFSSDHGHVEDNTQVGGSIVYAYYSKSGLEYLTILFPYKQTSIDQKNVPIIGVEDALAAVKKKYENVILTDPITITRIEFDYVPTLVDQSKGLFRMVPAWCFQLNQRSAGSTRGFNSNLIIDATSGREIP